MNVRRNLSSAGRRDTSIIEPLARLSIDLHRRGRADTDTVGRIGNTPVTVGMLKTIYELYSCVPFGEWPVPASLAVVDHWRNEWRLPVEQVTRSDRTAPVAVRSPTLTDVVTSPPEMRASNDTMVDRTESLTVVQRMCADGFGRRDSRGPRPRVVQQRSG
jgi:hypothetical protein